MKRSGSSGVCGGKTVCAARHESQKQSAHIVSRKFKDYISVTDWLTKQERKVIYFALALLLTGWAVKQYRTAHQSGVPTEEAKR